MRNEEALNRAEEERNTLHTMKRRKANCIGHILCRNCLLNRKRVGIEVTVRLGRRRKQLLDDLKETSDIGSGRRKH